MTRTTTVEPEAGGLEDYAEHAVLKALLRGVAALDMGPLFLQLVDEERMIALAEVPIRLVSKSDQSVGLPYSMKLRKCQKGVVTAVHLIFGYERGFDIFMTTKLQPPTAIKDGDAPRLGRDFLKIHPI